MKLKITPEEQIPSVRQLYFDAFPSGERKPFEGILERCRQGKMELLTIEDDGGFAGFAAVMLYKDMALLDYFAISADRRGGGAGGQTLELLKQRYAEKRFFLEIEMLDKNAENSAMRERRKQFYLRAGFIETGIFVRYFDCEMEVLAYNCNIAFEDYTDIYRGVMGEDSPVRGRLTRIAD